MVTRPLEAREHILDSTFSWRGLERRNKRLLACQRRTAMHLNREDEEGKGEILWWIPLVCFQPERPPLNGRRCGGTRCRSSTGQYRVISNAFRFNLSSTANCQLPNVQTGVSRFLYICIRSRLHTFTAPVVVLYREGKYIYPGAFEGVVIQARARSSSLIT